ncbi:MAG TPA: tetratricopeptide repeat protein, partial [Anaeromyxobacteraceae bacterium]|nr:tetratricopeptide repeat protein [Anaeromyxobacteraceae bacterium]
SSKEARAAFLEGREHLQNSETEAAAPLFDKAIGKDPSFALAYAHRAFAGGGYPVMRRNVDQAVALSEKASAGEKHYILARRAWADYDVAALASETEALLALHPADKNVHLFAGDVRLFFSGDAKGAAQHFRKAIELDGRYAAAHNQLAYAQIQLGDLSGAERSLKRYIELRPAFPNPYDSYAELLMKMGRFDESIAQYEKALAKAPGFVNALAGIGNDQTFKGEHARARETYQRMLDAAANPPMKLQALALRAASFVHEGRVDDAIAALDERIALAEKQGLVPGAIQSDLLAAFVLHDAGRIPQASRRLEAASRRNAASSLPAPLREAFANEIVLGRAFDLVAIGERDAAVALAEKARASAQVRKDAAQLKLVEGLLGVSELEAGRPEAALAHLDKADLQNPWFAFQRAVALERKGDLEAAGRAHAAVAHWNQNGLPYALVRARALAKVRPKS